MPTRSITLDVHQADLANVLRLFAEEGGINLVLDEDVRGKVTLSLRRVPWNRALRAILASKQLGSVWDGQILRVAPVERLRQEREDRSRQRQLVDSSAPLKTWIIPVNYARADELLPHVQKTLSPRGSAAVDQRTNVIIVQDIDLNWTP